MTDREMLLEMTEESKAELGRRRQYSSELDLKRLISEEPARGVVTPEPLNIPQLRGAGQDDGSTFKSGLTFLDEDVTDVVPVTDVTDLDTPDDSEYYLDRLAAVKDSLGPMPSFPTAGFMDPRISAQREKLQKRRNILRSLYGKGPKDIVWGTGKARGRELSA